MAINPADFRQFFIGHPSAVGVGVHRSSAVVSADLAIGHASSRATGCIAPCRAGNGGQPAGSHRTGTGNDYARHRATADHLLAARGGALRFEAIAQELGTDPVEREQGSLGGRPIWCSCAAWRRRQADFMQGCNPLPSVLFDLFPRRTSNPRSRGARARQAG